MRVRLILKVICAIIAVIRGTFWFIQEDRIQNTPPPTVYIIEQEFFIEYGNQLKDALQAQNISGYTYGIVLASTGMYYMLPPTQDTESINIYISAITQQSFTNATQAQFIFPDEYRTILFGSVYQSLADQIISDGPSLQRYQQATLTDGYQQNKKGYSYWYVIIYALIVMGFLLL